MRQAFIDTVTRLAKDDPNVWLVTGDLGFSVFEKFMADFPHQYLNVGVAEQDMIGISAGLAMAGKRPIAYSISTFASMRAYEQIRNDICYQNLPVTIVGGGSTFSYSTFGCTHMPMEDFAIMRALPNMAVLSPGDPLEVSRLLERAYARKGPAYMRIAKKGEPLVNAPDAVIEIGTATRFREGDDVALVTTGRLLPSVMESAEILSREHKVNATVLHFHTLKPFDEASLIDAAQRTAAIVSCEEHSMIGGLGSIVAETLARAGISRKLVTLAVPDEFPKGVGSQDYFLKRYHLDSVNIAARALLAISR